MTALQPSHVRFVRAFVAISVGGSLALLSTAPSSAVAKKTKITQVVVVTGQGTVTVSPCGKSTKGICKKGAAAIGGIARFGSSQGDVSIAVPAGIPIKITTSQGDVNLGNLDNPLTIVTDQGGVEGPELRSTTVTATTTQGDVKLNFATDPAKLTVTTNEGTIDLRSRAAGAEGEIRARSDQGDVTIVPIGPQKLIDVFVKQGTVDVVAPGGGYTVVATTKQGTVNASVVSEAGASRTVTAIVDMQGDVTVRPS
jgi:DUF4097 and DUF4098 domain-containing protein YvlB